MNNKQITIGGIIISAIVSGAVLLTSGQVEIPVKVNGDFNAIVYETVDDCELSRKNMLVNLDLKALKPYEASTLRGMLNKKCSIFTKEFTEEEKEVIKKLITDGENRVYYDYTDYMSNK